MVNGQWSMVNAQNANIFLRWRIDNSQFTIHNWPFTIHNSQL